VALSDKRVIKRQSNLQVAKNKNFYYNIYRKLRKTVERVANLLLNNLLGVTRQCESLIQQYLYRGKIPAINIDQGAVEKI